MGTKLSATDGQFLRKLRIDPGETAPATDEELAAAILASGDLDYEPTLDDWRECAEQTQREASQYFANWKAAERRIGKVERHANSLRRALCCSMSLSALLIFAIAVMVVNQ